MQTMRYRRPMALVLAIAVVFAALPLSAADLEKPTRDAFAKYVESQETRMQATLNSDSPTFLWLDRMPGERRKSTHQLLQKGEIVTARANQTNTVGRLVEIPGGLVHHWVGTIFIPNANAEQVLAVLQDYDNHKNLYQPEVVGSRLLHRDGDVFRAYLRFYKKKVIGVTLDTEHEARYGRLGKGRAYSISHSTSVREVEDAGKKDEKVLPEGAGQGFLWALNSYWRILEREGGVYVQCEAITLTRNVPTGLGWMIKPFITEVPRESLYTSLNSTRLGVQKKVSQLR